MFGRVIEQVDNNLMVMQICEEIAPKHGCRALLGACRFIHEARRAGDGVLVHCAQGKSRSATVVTAYVAALHALPVTEALARVQAGYPEP